jgi:hypothetical protein
MSGTLLYVTIKGQRLYGATPDVLRSEVRRYIDDNFYGASDVGGDWRVIGHPDIARISYNGRFWGSDGKEWKAA